MFKNLAATTKDFFRSWPNRIFALVVLLFVAEASYLAIMNSYPMAYDESYHFGLIQFYSQHLNPFVSAQDSSTYIYGNIVDNPSWLYHYLLSFPYRVLELTGSLRTEVTGLRMFSVAFVAASLVVLYRIAHQLRLPRWLGVLVVAIFALTPVVTVLSAQMNYDNLMILTTLLGVSLLLDLFKQAKNNQINLAIVSGLVLVVSIGSLAKFSFLPLALVIATTTIGIIVYTATRLKKDFIPTLRKSTSIGGIPLVILGTFAIAFASLATVSYGKNIVEYKTPVPDCGQVLNATACSAWGPWARNYDLAQKKLADPSIQGMSIESYAPYWAKDMWFQLYGSVAPNGVSQAVDVRLVKLTLILLLLGSLIASMTIVKLVMKYPQLLLFLGLTLVYLLVLFYRNYTENIKFGAPVAVQGRYLIPILGLFYLGLSVAVYSWFSNRTRLEQRAQYTLATMAVSAFIVWGGGANYTSTILPDYQWQYENNLQNAVSSAQLAVATKPTEN